MKTHGKNCKKHLIQIAGMLRSYPVVTIDFHPFWAPNRSNFFFRQERQLQASKKERKTAIQQVPMGGTVLNPPIFGECFGFRSKRQNSFKVVVLKFSPQKECHKQI